MFAQALTACGCDLFYYMNRKRGEVDFLVEMPGDVVPLEIKSGRTPRAHEALNKLLATPEYGLKRATCFRASMWSSAIVLSTSWYVTACLPEARPESAPMRRTRSA